MNKQELEHKLDELEELFAITKTNIEAMDLMIAELHAQLAEAEKPKLRCGDYITSDGEAIIIAPSQLPAFPMTSYNERGMACGKVEDGIHSTRHIQPLGNIFDDLKALAEPLEEFEYKGYSHGKKIKFEDDGGIDLGSLRRIKKEDIPAFILKLRRMEATMKAK